MNTFSIGEAIRFGWGRFSKRPGIFIGAVAITAIAQIGIRILGIIPVLGVFIAIVGSVFIKLGFVNFFVKAHDNTEGASIEGFWYPKPFWRVLGASIVVGFACAAPIALIGAAWGVTFLSVYGFSEGTVQGSLSPALGVTLAVLSAAALAWAIFLGVRLAFTTYLIIDKDRALIDAIKESFRMTKGSFWRLVGFFFTFALINVLGAAALLIGLFISVPVTALAYVHVYRALEHKANEVATV